jgi:hypothetical protein
MKLIALLFSLALLLVSFTVPVAEPSQRIAELQVGLTELGYDHGPVDGVLGTKTRDAIMAFQKDQRLAVDGEYSDILSMLVETERERAPLLAMSDDELTKLLEGASEDEVGRLLDLIPERVADFPTSLTFGKSLPPDGADVLFSMPLRLLFYPPSREGVEQFQADIGAEVTGELTLRQFVEANRRWLRQRDTPVYASGGAEVYMNDDLGWASARGTWLAEDEGTVTPINAVEITCDSERHECLGVTAELSVPSLDDDNSLVYLGRDADDYYLRLQPVRRYRIISRSGGEIVAQESRGCDVALLTLNRNSNRVQEVVTNDEDVHPNCRTPPPPFEKPRIARLTSGWATGREFWRKRQEVTSSYLNPRFAEEIKDEIKEALGTAEPLGLPGPAVGPSDGTQPTVEELIERRLRERQPPVDKRDE